MREYMLKDAQIDDLRSHLAKASNIELSNQTYKKENENYVSIGVMPNGNYIVRNSMNKYGVFDSNGNVVVPFIYDKIEPIMKQNGEIVHENFYIAQRKERKIIDPKDGKEFYVGDSKSSLISSLGDEILPFKDSKIEKILYEEEKDLIHCVNSGAYNDVYSQDGYAGYSSDVVTINGSKLEELHVQKTSNKEIPNTDEKIVPNQEMSKIDLRFIDQFNMLEKKYNEYLTMVSDESSYMDTNISTQLLDLVEYLFDELNKMKESIFGK